MIASHRRLSLLSGVLLLSPLRPGQESSSLARAASVDDKIDGKWQEFLFSLGGQAYPCTSECSSDPDSDPLGRENYPPWTVKSSVSCLRLDVIEGFGGGHAVFEVFNNDVSLGNTTDVPVEKGSSSCQYDPTICYFDSGVTKGEFVLQKDVQHSIRIVARRADFGGTDRGWFRLTSVACDGGPACSKARSVCTPSTRCCRGLVCRKSQPAVGQSRCLACAQARRYCAKNADCCSKKCANKTKRCAP